MLPSLLSEFDILKVGVRTSSLIDVQMLVTLTSWSWVSSYCTQGALPMTRQYHDDHDLSQYLFTMD